MYTRATAGATFCLTDTNDKSHFVDGVDVEHNGTGTDDNERPTSKIINEKLIRGPVKVKIKADSNANSGPRCLA